VGTVSAIIELVANVRGLGATVFLAGAASLATEMGASRLIAPYFGSSNVVWANVIGLMLAFLALGYWLGGRLADSRPERRLLAQVLLLAALLLAATPFAARPLLRVALHGFDVLSIGVVLGSFAGVLVLFVLPVTLMGAVSPFAIRLAISDIGEAGRIAGRLYALSTVGGILGTFVAALVTIPLVGTQRTLLGAAGLLALAAVPLAPRGALAVAVLVAAVAALPPGGVKRSSGVIWEGESQYQYVRVVQSGDGSRALEENEGIAEQSVWYPHSVLTGGYWDQLQVLPRLLARPARNVLVLGNAGGTVSRAFNHFYPLAHVDGVELDPLVSSAGRRFLGLRETPRMRTITADARVFLESTQRRYDVIVVDAYRQPYIPFQLATEEFFQLVRAHLAPGGVIALNVAATPRDRRLTEGVGTTLASVFPQVWRWSALRFSDILFAFGSSRSRSDLTRRAGTVALPLRPLAPLFRRELTRLLPHGTPWTDDRAPVEWVTDRMLAEQIARGQGLDEHPLPTQP
jgi:spermidine synthase